MEEACTVLLNDLFKEGSMEWMDSLQKILFNLKVNGEYLCNKYTADQIVTFNNEVLAENINDAAAKLKREKNKIYTELLKRQFGDDKSKTIFCRQCGVNSDVEWNIKQTRSADEGSTIFCVCKVCNTRWKM